MNVLFISYYYGETASGVVSRRTAEALAELGVNLTVVTSSADKGYSRGSIEFHSCENILQPKSILFRVLYRTLKIFFPDIYNYNLFWRRRCLKECVRLTKLSKPDWIYCRTTPIDACVVGARLKSLIDIPLLCHFTDPIPAPYPHIKKERSRLRLSHISNYVINNCNLVSFGTAQMRDYQCSLTPSLIKKEVFISPDAASSDEQVFSSSQSDNFVLAYLGTFGGTRNPQNLFAAIRQLNENGFNVILKVYSDRPIGEEPMNSIQYMGSVREVDEVLKQASCFVDMDGDDNPPVFTSSKLKDYLLHNRPILSITPLNSPTRELLKDKITAFVTINDKEVIYKTLLKIISSDLSNENYSERKEIVEYFSPQRIATELFNHLANGEANRY